MTTAARLTVVPTFNVEQFAKEAARLTVVPPSFDRPTWKWLNETAVPSRNVPPQETSINELGHRAAFVLLHVDGVSSLRDIVKNTGIPRQDALGILAAMIERGFISLEDDAPVYLAEITPASGIHELMPRIFTPGDELDELSWDDLGANDDLGLKE